MILSRKIISVLNSKEKDFLFIKKKKSDLLLVINTKRLFGRGSYSLDKFTLHASQIQNFNLTFNFFF